MKKLWSKNALIAVLLISNFSFGAYILVERHGLRWWGGLKAPAKKVAPSPQRKAAASVPTATLKYDHELQACYEALLAGEPDVEEGTVHVHMTITENGDVDLLKMIHSDLSDSEFNECVLEKIKSAKVPASSDRVGVIISHKFNFHKRNVGSLEFEN